MIKKYLGLFLLFCSFPSLAFSQENFEGLRIQDILVSIEKQDKQSFADTQAIVNRLSSKKGDPFSQVTFDKDLKSLAEEYDRVEPKLEASNKQLNISLKVWFKPRIRSITWEGNEKIKTHRLQKHLGIPTSHVFDRASFNKAFHKVKAYYVKKGYFEAQLDYEVQQDPEEQEVDILVKVKEGRSGRISDILFEGFDSEEESDLLNLLVTSKYNFFTSWFTGSGTYHSEAVEQDKLNIVNYLQNKGFADAQVDIRIEEDKKSGKIKVLIRTEKGPLYQMGRITFSGHSLFENEQISSQFTLRKGDPYSPEKIRQSTHNIQDLYGMKGYIESYVTYEPRRTPGKNEYSLHCTIHEGEKYRVGLIKIFGNVSTNSRVILHESLLVPGDTFDIRKLQATEEKLRMIGYFKNVNVYWVKLPKDKELGSNFRDVHIEVEETSTGSFSLAFGVSTLESVFGSVEIMERNFNYKGLSRVFKDGPGAMRGDGEYARARLNVGKKHRNLLFSWTKPYFLDTPWVFGFNAEKVNNRQQSKDYDIDSLGFGLHASYPINAYLRFEWIYRLRDIEINVNGDASQSLKNEADNSGLVSASGVALTYDSTDHPYKPKNGFLSRLDLEYAGLGGDFNFLGMSYTNSYYVPLHENGVFKYRADLKFIHPLGSTTGDSLPLAERLFLGGETSIRGYRGFSVGPKYDNRNPKGGVSSALLSLEYLHNISERLDAFTFLDSGHVSEEKYRIGQMRTSYGYGIRIELFPNMPLIMGMGYPVNPESLDEVKRFFFSIGGKF